MRYAPEWSADGKRIAFSDKDGGLYVLTMADKTVAEVARSIGGAILGLRMVAQRKLSGIQHG